MNMRVRRILAVAGRVRMRSGCFHMIELLRRLGQAGCEVSLLCGRMSGDLFRGKPPFPVHVRPDLVGDWPLWGAFHRVEDFLAGRRADVVHLHGGGLGAAADRLADALGVPVVFTPHSSIPGGWRLRRVYRRASKVLALSESLRESLVNRTGIPKEKVVLARPGVAVDEYPESPPDIGSRMPVVGTAAPLEPLRGQEIFLDAARRLLDAGVKAEFVLAGDGRMERSLRRQVRRLGLRGNVTFVTNLRRYRDAIGTFDVFVRPTLSGGIGHTVIEAMAMAKPVVAVAAEGVLEIIEDGCTGIAVPRNDTSAMAAAISRILGDPVMARRMGSAARRFIIENFNAETLVNKVLAIYQEVRP